MARIKRRLLNNFFQGRAAGRRAMAPVQGTGVAAKESDGKQVPVMAAARIFVLKVGLATLLWQAGRLMTRDNREYQLYEMSTRDGRRPAWPPATGALPWACPWAKVVARIGFDPQISGNVLLIHALPWAGFPPVTRRPPTPTRLSGVTGLAHINSTMTAKSSQPLRSGPSGLPRLPMKSSPLNMHSRPGPVLLERVDRNFTPPQFHAG